MSKRLAAPRDGLPEIEPEASLGQFVWLLSLKTFSLVGNESGTPVSGTFADSFKHLVTVARATPESLRHLLPGQQ
jgi:hypothetical protein